MLLLSVMMTVQFASANGQSSHLWISEQAIQRLPDGSLKELLSDAQFEPQWRNGTMFPDGGYAVDDIYGEMAHWEPFQRAYLAWIQESYTPPWTPEAKEHIAFLMGLASHGLADQSYDAMYFRRAYVYDATSTWEESFDTATDVAFVAETHIQPTVDVWVPSIVYDIYQQQGHTVTPSVVEQGQSRLNLAVYWVGTTASQPDLVDDYQAQYPWGTTHQLDSSVAGNPSMEADIVVEYWQSIWRELNDGMDDPLLLFTHPLDKSVGHPTNHEDIESSISMGLSVGINVDALQPEHIQVVDGEGQSQAILVDVFYGNNSHIINIEPLEDWSISDFTVILDPELPLNPSGTIGQTLEWTFSTRSEPSTNDSNPDSKAGCASVSLVEQSIWMLLLGGVGIRRREPWI
jgi:hypothetical protein